MKPDLVTRMAKRCEKKDAVVVISTQANALKRRMLQHSNAAEQGAYALNIGVISLAVN